MKRDTRKGSSVGDWNASLAEFSVTVYIPSTVREGLPDGGQLVVTEPVGTLGELTEALDRMLPGLAKELSSTLYTFAINDEVVLMGKWTRAIRSGDHIEVMPVFAGG